MEWAMRQSTRMTCVVGLLLIGVSLVCAAKEEAAVVLSAKGTWKVVTGTASKTAKNPVAWGIYDNTIMETGWAQLHIKTGENFDDQKQMFAAGYLEGYLTRHQILAFHENTKADHESIHDPLRKFMTTQDTYLRDQVKANKGDVFWIQVNLVLQQLDGIIKGYNENMEVSERLDLEELWIINMDGDLIELENALERKIDVINIPCGGERSDDSASDQGQPRFQHLDTSVSSTASSPGLRWQKSLLHTLSHHAATSKSGPADAVLAPESDPLLRFKSQEQTASATKSSGGLRSSNENDESRRIHDEMNSKFVRLMRRSRCTAVVKLTEDHTDLLMAHNSWEDYVEMLRVFKHFQFHLSASAKMAAVSTSFSSYPGMLSSTDDFYMMSSGLAVIETTVNLMDDSLLEKICAKNGVASWVRSMVANRIATTGEEWADTYSRLNSGTYNCQWMIADYNLLKKAKSGGDLVPGTFWVVETVPGFSHKADMTEELQRRSYWPSANRPYFPETRQAAGYSLNPAIPAGSTVDPVVVPGDTETDSVDPIGEDMGLGSSKEEPALPMALAAQVRPMHMAPLQCPAECSDMISFENNPRGAVLRKHAAPAWSSADAMAKMKTLMRLNGWHESGDDGMSYDPSVAVAARYDLLREGKSATGAVDAKITNAAGMERMIAQVIGGPTTQDHKPFNFDDWPEIPHAEMPAKWDFDWFEAEGYSKSDKAADVPKVKKAKKTIVAEAVL